MGEVVCQDYYYDTTTADAQETSEATTEATTVSTDSIILLDSACDSQIEISPGHPRATVN